MIYMVEFGKHLRNAREEKGITQQTLAEELFVARQTVSHWECGKRYPDLITAKRITQILDVSLEDLLSEKDMAKEEKRDPVVEVENEASNNMMLALYTVIIMFMIRSPFSNFMGFYTEAIRFVQEAELFMMFVRIHHVVQILYIVIFTYCVFNAVKRTLTPKRIGIVWLIFFTVNALFYFCNFFSVFRECLTWQVVLLTFADILLNAFGAVGSVSFFIKNENCKIWSMILRIVSVLGFFGDVVLYYAHEIKMSRLIPNYLPGPGAVLETLILRLPLYVLIIYQAIVLYRRQDNTAEVSGKVIEEGANV